MGRDINEELLVHYVVGECTEQERVHIEAWMRDDPAHRQRVEELRRIWKEADGSDSRDVDAMWTKLSHRMKPADSSSSDSSAPRRRKSPFPRSSQSCRFVWSQSLRVAASVACIAVVAFLIGQMLHGTMISSDQPTMRKVTTDAGERARVTLGDGTYVILNAQSTLTLPRQFASGHRSVRLQGEAYFEVTSDTERPFIVEAGGTITKVLGTKFNIGAYSDDETVEVVVAEGKVNVRPRDAQDEQALLLTRHQMGRVSKNRRRALRQDVDVSNFLAWTEGRLVFRDTPFQEVARKLERWYDIQIRWKNVSSDVDHLNASFTKEPLVEVLSVIAESLGLRYERNGSVVTFAPAAPQ